MTRTFEVSWFEKDDPSIKWADTIHDVPDDAFRDLLAQVLAQAKYRGTLRDALTCGYCDKGLLVLIHGGHRCTNSACGYMQTSTPSTPRP